MENKDKGCQDNICQDNIWEATVRAVNDNYNCNGKYGCPERDACCFTKGTNTAFDCCECGADEFADGFKAGVDWAMNQYDKAPWKEFVEMVNEMRDNRSVKDFRHKIEDLESENAYLNRNIKKLIKNK